MDNANQEYIQSYWRNELTETERQAFENKCVEDESFASSVAQFMQLKQIATDTEKNRLKSLYNDSKATNNRNRLILITAAFVIAAIVLRMFFFSNNAANNIPPVSEEQIFAMLVDENRDANRGENDLKENIYKKWFEEEKYDTLLFQLEAVNLANVVNVDALIWATQSLYIQKKHVEIINLIDDYMKNNVDDISRKDELLWLQTLAYLKLNNKEKVKSNLEKIIADYRLYQDEAKKMLNSLD